MRKRFGLMFAAPLAAVMIAACGGSDGANDDRRAQGPQTNAPEATTAQTAQSAQATVNLTGCLETEASVHGWVLRNVHFAGAQGDSAQRDTTTNRPHGITEGSWVRLDGGDQDLRSHAGQRVTIAGIVSDSGQNTVGTSGTAEGVVTPSGDRSMASSAKDTADKVKAEAGRIAQDSMANGTAAEITVQRIQPTGERCGSEARQEAR